MSVSLELEQVGSLLTPEVAGVVIVVAAALFVVLGFRYVQPWRRTRTPRSY